jgi:hypothetical protein
MVCSTILNIPGKQGGDTKTYNICCTKVYSQTLFLGGSVKAFNASLAWGSEASKLTVEISVDKCDYPVQKDLNGNIVLVMPEANSYTVNRLNNTFQKDENGNSLIPAKVYYKPYYDTTKKSGYLASYYWTGSDPGFYGEIFDAYGNVDVAKSVDIVGCAVYFKYDDFEFYGIVKGWQRQGGSSGTITYSIDIESPSFLLTQTQMILSDYNGAIFSKTNGSDGSQFTKFGFPKTNAGTYTGAISEQNIPNLINVFGYLEDSAAITSATPAYRYGRSERNDQGISALYIMQGIYDLLNSTKPVTSNKQKILRYSPYGRIVGKAPKFKSSLNDVFVSLNDLEQKPYSFGLLKPSFYTKYTDQNLDLYVMPYSINFNDILNNGIIPSYYRISDQKMDLLQFFTTVAENTGQNIFISMELDITEEGTFPVIKINSISKLINSPDGIVQEFIDDIVSKGVSVTSYSKGEELNNNDPIRTMVVGGKQQRLYQVSNLKYALKQSTLRYSAYVNKFVKIDHFNALAGSESQQRYRLFDPVNIRNPDLYRSQDKTPALPFGRVELYSAAFKEKKSLLGGYVQNKGNYLPEISFVKNELDPTKRQSKKGGWVYDSYIYDAICPYFGNDELTGYVRPVFQHYNNMINDISASSISADGNGGGVGFLVGFTLAEIGAAIGVNYSQANFRVRISETEIRAAMSGYDAYVAFLTGMLEDGVVLNCFNSVEKPNFPVDIWKHVLGPIIMPVKVAAGAASYDSFSSPFLKGLVSGLTRDFNVAATTGVSGKDGNASVALAAQSSVATDPRLYDILVKLHGFFKNIGDTYYGKQYMINVPSPQVWTDVQYFKDTQGNNLQIPIGVDSNNKPIYLLSGSKKTYYSFEPTDFAWEEPGNYIDDCLMVGNAILDPLTKDDGSIEPILGFNNTTQYNYGRELAGKLYAFTYSLSANAQAINLWKWDMARAYGLTYSGTEQMWEPALSLKDSGAVVVPHPLGSNNPSFDPYGTKILDENISKIYVKAKVEKEFAKYIGADGNIYTKIIMSLNNPVFLNALTPDTLSVTNAVAEYFISDYTGASLVTAIRALGNSLFIKPTPLETSVTAKNAASQNKANKQFNNLSIHPKAAMPFFAGVPIVDNTSVYGPWVSAPDLLKDVIFPSDAGTLQIKKIENLIGGAKVEIESDFVPWNYGGMRILDEVALLKVGQDNDYLQKLESGSLTIHGVPFINLGNELKTAGNLFRGPTVSNIQCQISESGPSTTYTFRTFTKKFTLFNKENSDRIKQAAQATQKMSREFRKEFNAVSEILRTIATSPTVNSSPSFGADSILRSYSPVDVLVGYSAPFWSRKAEPANLMGFFPNPLKTTNQWSGNSIKQMTTVNIQERREVVQEFEQLYSTKSFMSMDGLLHPVSFYPTMLSSTTPYKPYLTTSDGKISGCPICRGTKTYIWEDKTFYCDYCSNVSAGQEPNSSTSNGRLPPYILSNQADEDIIKDPQALEKLLQSTVMSKKIDYVNLNPIIMPVGELRNKFAQSNDYTSHHIDIVGRSVVPPVGSLSINSNLNIDQQPMVDPLTGELTGLEYFDQNRMVSDGDWNSVAFDMADGRVAKSANSVQVGGKSYEYFQNNHRFLALRGPLVMAGWGYDVDGMPVPNASGEPKELNAGGYPKRIRDKKDQTGGFQDYAGTILGKNQTWDNDKEEWTDPIKESEFYKGWGLRPDSWPVGPVDLRWDENRKVWTAAQPYKLVDVQLEDDLVPPFPARAFFNSMDKTSPLPNNLRRMIFVRDSTESYGAPRGAKITCYYDEASGFYEPISKQNIVAMGTISSNGTAKILNAYAKGFDPITGEPETPEQITVEFNNYLNFDISQSNQAGIFTFIKNEWILTSSNTCGG